MPQCLCIECCISLITLEYAHDILFNLSFFPLLFSFFYDNLELFYRQSVPCCNHFFILDWIPTVYSRSFVHFYVVSTWTRLLGHSVLPDHCYRIPHRYLLIFINSGNKCKNVIAISNELVFQHSCKIYIEDWSVSYIILFSYLTIEGIQNRAQTLIYLF